MTGLRRFLIVLVFFAYAAIDQLILRHLFPDPSDDIDSRHPAREGTEAASPDGGAAS